MSGPTQARTLATRRRSRRLVALGLVGVALVIVALGLLRLRAIASDLSDARDALRDAELDVQEGRLLAARSALTRAERLVARANGAVHTSAELAPARLIPVVRQNVDALRRSVALALTLTNGGREVLDAAQPLQGRDGRLDVSLRSGVVPVAAVRDVGTALREVAFELPRGARPGRWVMGPIRDLEADVLDEAARRRQQFVSVSRALEVLTEIAGGNGARRYLIAVANAAEMRGTGGMILSYGELVSADGKLSLERFGPIDDLALRGESTGEPLSYPERFAEYTPLTTWRNTNLSSDFTVVARVQEDLYTDVTGKPLNGVIQVDSFGLAALLRITGPVAVTGAPVIDANNVVPFTLNENYFRVTDRGARQEAQGEVAEAVFRRLVTGDFPAIRDLGAVIAEAAEGRHVMLHSTTPAIQRTVALLGADGALPDLGNDFAHLTVQNFSGTKLDYYLDTSLDVAGGRPAGRVSRLKVRIEVGNTAPRDGRNVAVFGPIAPGFAPGEYRGLVSVYLPLGSHVSGSSGSDTLGPIATDTELDRTVVNYGISLPAGQRHVVTFDVVVPSRAAQGYRFELVPAPRVRPTNVSLNLDLGDRSIRQTVPLRRPYAFLPE